MPRLPSRRLALSVIAAAFAAPAFAQVPTIKLYVGYTAGGPVDAAARLFAPALGRELGANVVVENKPGANATLAGDLVAKAPPDGLQLWFAASPTLTISPNVMKRMPFDIQRDLTPVAPVTSYYNVLVIHKELPLKNVKELVDYAKAHPAKVSYGSAGIGGSNHLSGELFASQTGTQMTHVPYKGNAPAMTDVIAGNLTMMFDIIGSARTYIAGQRVRAMAVTSPQRNPSLPDVPTMAEAGLPGFDVGGWYGVYAPPGLPAAMLARYNEASNRALQQPELKARFAEMGYEPWAGTPKVLSERADKERAMWATVTRGITIE